MFENYKAERLRNYFTEKYHKQLSKAEIIEKLDNIGMSSTVLASVVGFGSMVYSCASGGFLQGPDKVTLTSVGVIMGGMAFHSISERIRTKIYKKAQKYNDLLTFVNDMGESIIDGDKLKAREKSLLEREHAISQYALGGECEQLEFPEIVEEDPNQLTIESFDMEI